MGKDLERYSSNNSADSFSFSSSPLWVRLTAFLSMKSENTQVTYIGVIKEWCSFLGAEAGTPEAARLFLSATELDAIRYRGALFNRPGQKPRITLSESKEIEKRKRTRLKASDGLDTRQTNATVAKKLAILRRLYRLAVNSDLGISKNPFDSDRVPPPPKESGKKRPTEMISYKKVKEILSMPGEKTVKGLRDTTILALLFGAGLRRSEVCKIRLTDLDISEKGTTYIYLRATKGKSDYEQALPEWAANYVKKLYYERKRQGARSGDYLFVSYTGKGGCVATKDPISPSGIYQLFKFYCKKAGVKNFVSPHSARATAITKLLDDGLNHREVQSFSRHKSVQMVEVYDKRRRSVDESPAKKLKF